MSHGPEHQMEHAEHAAHAAHDKFNKQVTMSIAIVAAVLACVTMLGHRAHNETLRLQGEALGLQTQASIKSTQAANKWAYYQSKNTFDFESEIVLDLLKVLAPRDGADKDLKEVVARYEDMVAYYSGNKDHRMSGKRLKAKKDGAEDSSDEKAEGKLKKAEDDAHKLDEQAEELKKNSKEKLAESHLTHEKGNRFDLGELGLQFGVVLCSLAILTKGRGFWFVGLASAAVGLAIALTGQFGLFIEHH